MMNIQDATITIIDNATGHKYVVCANGSVEGFENDRIILNKIPLYIYREQMNEREECAKLCDGFALASQGTESAECALYLAQLIRRKK